MAETRPLLYLSRLLPDPVMIVIRERYRLVTEPCEQSPGRSELQAGLRDAEAAIVTLSEHIDAETLRGAARLRIVANYAVGYNNIDLPAAINRGLVVSKPQEGLTVATRDSHGPLLLPPRRRLFEGT